MRTALYCHTSRLGGAEMAAPALAEALEAEIWMRGDGPAIGVVRASGRPLLGLPARVDVRAGGVVSALRAVWSLALAQPELLRMVRLRRPDVLVSNSIQGLLHLILVRMFTRVPIIAYVRDLGSGGNRGKLEVAVYRRLLSVLSSGMVFNSELTRESWDVARPHVVCVSAIDDSFFRAEWKGGTGRDVVMVGRISRWKGQAEVVAALNLLASEGRPATLTLVGSTQFEERDDGLPSADFPVHRVGFTDPIPYLVAADLVVHASVAPEPLGQVIAQAAAVGAPIVCADRGGQREWLRDGHSCLMVDPRDVSALAQVVDDALSDPSAAAERARNASYAAEIFRQDRAYVAMRLWLETLIGTDSGDHLA